MCQNCPQTRCVDKSTDCTTTLTTTTNTNWLENDFVTFQASNAVSEVTTNVQNDFVTFQASNAVSEVTKNVQNDFVTRQALIILCQTLQPIIKMTL